MRATVNVPKAVQIMSSGTDELVGLQLDELDVLG